MLKAILVSLASLTALVGVATASANDEDFAIHHEVYEPSITAIGLPARVWDGGFPIEYHRGQEECVLRLAQRYTGGVDTLTVRVANARPVYRFDGFILGCHQMGANKFRDWVLMPSYPRGY